MRLPPSAFSVLLVCLVGCGKSAKECKADAEALGKLLHDAPHDVPFAITGRHLVARADLPDLEVRFAPTVNITKAGVMYQGEAFATQAGLERRLEAAHRQAVDDVELGKGRDIDPELVYLVVDEDVTWDRVVMAFDAADAAGMGRQAFVFTRPGKVVPPPRTAVDAELDRLEAADAAEKATRVAKLIQARIAGCKSLHRLFGDIAMVEGSSKADMLIDGLPKALTDCECNVDMPQLRSLLWRMLATPEQLSVFAFAPRVRDETIALPASTTWAEASKKLAPPLRGAKLVVQ